MNRILWKNKEYEAEIMIHKRVDNLVIVLYELDSEDFPDCIVVSLPLEDLEYGEIGINSFGENLGMINALMDAEVVEHPHRYLLIPIKDMKQTVPIVRLKHSFTNLLGYKITQSKQKSQDVSNSARPAAKWK
jgi:hypothetical protein